MPTTSTPAIAAAQARATAASPVAAPRTGNAGAREVAACFGCCCPDHGRCKRYRGVEKPGQERFISTCRTPEGAYPLFVLAVEPLLPVVVVGTDTGEVD